MYNHTFLFTYRVIFDILKYICAFLAKYFKIRNKNVIFIKKKKTKKSGIKYISMKRERIRVK